jgi:hypothetical protein
MFLQARGTLSIKIGICLALVALKYRPLVNISPTLLAVKIVNVRGTNKLMLLEVSISMTAME